MLLWKLLLKLLLYVDSFLLPELINLDFIGLDFDPLLRATD